MFGDAEFLVVRNNRIRNFNAQIKSNGIPGPGGPYVFPDDARIERNVLYDTHVRNTAQPVTKLDVVGGRRWIVRANTIYDYVKGGGDQVSYAAFLKGNSGTACSSANGLLRRRSPGHRPRLPGGGGPASVRRRRRLHLRAPERHPAKPILNCNDDGIYLNRESTPASAQHPLRHGGSACASHRSATRGTTDQRPDPNA